MAFCKYCGKELKDGEVCSCQQAAPAAEAALQESPAPQAAPAGEAPQAAAVPALDTDKILKSVKASGKHFVDIFTKPATAGKEFVANADMTTSLCIIVAQALLSSIFSLVIAGKINAVLKEAFGGFASLFGGSANGSMVSSVKAFFLTLLFSLLGSALLFALFLGATMITKVKIYWRQLAALAAVRSVAIAPFILVSMILVLINPALGFGVFFGSVLLALAFLLESVKGVEGVKDNKALYMVFIVMAVFIVIYLFVFSKVIGLYLPKDFSSGLSGLMNFF